MGHLWNITRCGTAGLRNFSLQCVQGFKPRASGRLSNRKCPVTELRPTPQVDEVGRGRRHRHRWRDQETGDEVQSMVVAGGRAKKGLLRGDFSDWSAEFGDG